MPIDPSLALQIKPAQDPLDQAAKAMTLKHLLDQRNLAPLQQQAAQQQLQTGQLQNQKMQQDMEREKALRKSFVVGDDGKIDPEASYNNMLKIDPKAANEFLTNQIKTNQEFAKNVEERHTRVNTELKNNAAAIQTRYDALVQQLGGGEDAKAKAWETIKPLIQGSIASLKSIYPKDIQGDGSDITPDKLLQKALENPEYRKLYNEKNKPLSAEGKILADVNAGRLTAEQGRKALEKKDAIRVNVNSNSSVGFEGKNGEILAALAERGISLPAGFRSRGQQIGLLNALQKKNPDLSADEIAEKIKNGQIDITGAKKEVSIAAGIAGKIAYAENEIQQTIPLVREASAKLPRGKFVPYEKLKQMGEKELSDPDLAEFKMYMNSLSNAYDMLAARGGTDMEKRKENRRNFDTASSPEALERILTAVSNEAKASSRAGRASMDVTHKDEKTPTAKTQGGATVSNW